MQTLARILMMAAFVLLIVFVTLAFAWNTLGLILWGITLFFITLFLGGLVGVMGDRRNARRAKDL